jgi:hypothetical protein
MREKVQIIPCSQSSLLACPTVVMNERRNDVSVFTGRIGWMEGGEDGVDKLTILRKYILGDLLFSLRPDVVDGRAKKSIPKKSQGEVNN